MFASCPSEVMGVLWSPGRLPYCVGRRDEASLSQTLGSRCRGGNGRDHHLRTTRGSLLLRHRPWRLLIAVADSQTGEA